MADDVDVTNERMIKESDMFVADIRRQAAAIPQGQAGECGLCGETFARLVYIDSVEAYCCCRCRDKRGLG